jgi:broad specificity phosphatase PhoE
VAAWDKNLRKNVMKLQNKYYIMRHGQALANLKNMLSCWPETFINHLTEAGREKVAKTSMWLKNKEIDLIFSSDLLRAKQTAEIVAKRLKVKIRFNKKLREQNGGIFNGQAGEKLTLFFGPRGIKRFTKKPPKGETYLDIEKRMLDFIKEIDKKYKGKTILIISHEMPLMLLESRMRGIKNKDFYEKRWRIDPGQSKQLLTKNYGV